MLERETGTLGSAERRGGMVLYERQFESRCSGRVCAYVLEPIFSNQTGPTQQGRTNHRRGR